MNGRKHILLADDEAGLLFSAGLALRMAGFQVSEAADGKAALDMLLRSMEKGAPVDLLVTDLRMPKLSGAELVSTIRQRKIDVAVFVVSGYFDESVLRELSLAGCEEYMEKPFQLEELVRRVEGILCGKAA